MESFVTLMRRVESLGTDGDRSITRRPYGCPNFFACLFRMGGATEMGNSWETVARVTEQEGIGEGPRGMSRVRRIDGNQGWRAKRRQSVPREWCANRIRVSSVYRRLQGKERVEGNVVVCEIVRKCRVSLESGRDMWGCT